MKLVLTNARFQPLRGDTTGELQLVIARLDDRLRRAARTIAEGDRDLADDLYEVAVTQLWEMDPSRFDQDDEGYLWRSMVNRMLNARRDDGGDPTRAPLALRFR